jgi:hypothetical protein
LVNPGSVGQPAWDDSQPFYHAVENGSPDARYAIVERRAARWRTELVAVPYDYRPMAELAIRNGRRDWESILCRGYVATPPEPRLSLVEGHSAVAPGRLGAIQAPGRRSESGFPRWWRDPARPQCRSRS